MSALPQRVAIVLAVMLVVGCVLAQEQSDIAQRLHDGELSTDITQWDNDTRKEFFRNVPTEYRQKFLDTYAKLLEANRAYWQTRVELFRVIHPLFDGQADKLQSQGRYEYTPSSYGTEAARQTQKDVARYLYRNWSEFQHYPEWCDPDKQTEYWNLLAEESLFLHGKTIEELQKITKVQKQQADEFQQRLHWLRVFNRMTFEDLPRELEHPNFFVSYYRWGSEGLPLTDGQKSQLLNDEPLLLRKTTQDFINPDYYPQFAEIEFLKEARNAEREPWKIDATPELAKLGINQAEVNRWDGSTSLHPVIHAIAKRCEGVDAAALQTTINYDYRYGFAMNTVRTGKTLSNTHPALMKLISGDKDVVFSTRRLSQKELDAAEKAEVELVQIPFAKDAFVFLQNRQNPLRNLTLEQYQDIFSGKFLKERQETWGERVVTRKSQIWKDVGGFGGNIVPFIRDEDSGSEELMKMLVMRGVPISRQLSWKMLDGMSAVYPELAREPGAIAYTVYHYDRYMVFSPYTRAMGVNGIFPSASTIASGEYPLVYECVLVHRKNPGEKVERFVQWLLSDEGQRLVRSVGYVPMDKLQ